MVCGRKSSVRGCPTLRCFMIEFDILLIGKADESRDHYESALRDRHFRVLTCDNHAVAAQLIENTSVRLIIVHDPSEHEALDVLLQHKQETRPRLPVFFSGQSGELQRGPTGGRFGAIPLPPGLPAGALAQMLQSFVDLHDPATPQKTARNLNITISRTTYAPVFQQAKQEFEAEYISRALERERGNVSRTARMLGMARRNLQLKIRTYNIDLEPMRGVSTVNE